MDHPLIDLINARIAKAEGEGAFDNLPERFDAYDYFAVTAGPMTLSDRFSGRAASRSLIDRPASGYRSTAA